MQQSVSGVAIDSRLVAPGDLFFALSGNRVDGHAYVNQAVECGAAAVVVSRLSGGVKAPQLLVEDTMQALQQLAEYYRNLFQLPVVAVTGSTGKTSTKDLIAAVLSQRYQTLKTEGNHNNELGLPLTLLQLDRSCQAVVLEMAMRGHGEIAALCRIAHPVVGVITNIGLTHLERLGTQQGIVEAKGELLEALPEQGCAIINGDDQWLQWLAERYHGQVLRYGEGELNGVRSTAVHDRGLEGCDFHLITPDGEVDCRLPIPGRHNLCNALAAATVGHYLGMTPTEIAAGLATATLTGMRLEVKDGLRGCRIIDDSYNASPASTNAALQLLGIVEKRRSLAVLGDMFELGKATVTGHREVGATVARLNIDYLCTVGELAREIAKGALLAGMDPYRVSSYLDQGEAIAYLRGFLEPGDLMLVKGSRGMQMDRLVAALGEEGERQ